MKRPDSIEIRPTNSLIPYARNARTHSEAQVAQIAASIKEFGFCNPVLIDKSDGIIAGHGRVLAAQKLGLAEVPVLVLGHLTENQERAYILADNKLALNAGWDENMLKLELSDGADILGIFGDAEEDIREEVERFENEPEELIDITVSINSKWYKDVLRKIQPKIRKTAQTISETVSDGEIEQIMMYVFLVRRFFKSTKKRFSLTVPLSEPIWEKFAINPDRAVLEFQEFLNAKYNQ